MADLYKEENWLITASLVILALVMVGITLIYAQSVLIPFVLAVFIFILVSPVLDFQVLRLNIPRSIAAAVTLIILLVIMVAASLLVTQAAQIIISTVGGYTDNFARLIERGFAQVQEWGLDVNQTRTTQDLQKQIPKLVTNTVGTVFGFFSSMFLVTVFLIFLVIGRNPHVVHKGIYADIDRHIRKYLATKAVISIVTGTLVWIILSGFKLKLASVFGMLAFLLNFIPSIGSIIATLLPIPVAVAQFENPWFILAVVLMPGIVQMIIGNIIEPKIMGRGMHLHPITVLLALAFWGLLWGIVGMFLAVPMTAIIRIVLMQFDTLKPVANLLAGQLPSYQEKQS